MTFCTIIIKLIFMNIATYYCLFSNVNYLILHSNNDNKKTHDNKFNNFLRNKGYLKLLNNILIINFF